MLFMHFASDFSSNRGADVSRASQVARKPTADAAGARVCGVTSRPKMTTIGQRIALGKSSVILSRSSAFTLLIATITGCILLQLPRAQAQWWSRAPADFEECAETAQKAATKEDRAYQLTACNAKFAGRRKPGGGYTYFDFMQNRSFDIAGPNPTPEEQKKIDQQYTAFLDQERRSRVLEQERRSRVVEQERRSRAIEQERRSRMAAEATAKEPLLQQASLKDEKVTLPAAAPHKPKAAVSAIRSRPKATPCAQHSFSCDWPRLSEGINDLKKLFSPPPGKPNAPGKAKRS
jgi:hypothetical protein